MDNEFDGPNDYMKHLREMEKETLKIDLHRGSYMPLSIKDFLEMFGEPSDEDLHDITQAYLKQYHTHGDDIIEHLIEAYSREWINLLLQYNVTVEEYEICAILKEHLDIHTKWIKKE